MARHNFSKPVINQLGRRVSLRCSNPDCRVPTVAAKRNGDDSLTIGVAAHICAASKGGPRYDGSMEKADRVSIDNGIWLCSACATKIDRDSKFYTEELLRTWKTSAEELAIKELGKKLPSADDAINMLSGVINGQLKKYIPQAIETIHKASDKALEELDPRFSLSSSYVNGITRIEVHAKEPTRISMEFKSDEKTDYPSMFQSLLEKGGEIEIPTEHITVSGSRLIEEIVSEKGKLRIQRPTKTANIKIWAASLEGGAQSYLDDMVGELAYGSKECSFTGNCCNKIIGLNFSRAISEFGHSSPINIGLDFHSWKDKNIVTLPFFDRIYSFFSTLYNKGSLNILMEIEGLQIFSGKVDDLNLRDFVIDTYFFLRYTKAARTISKFTRTDLYFDPQVTFSAQEMEHLLHVEKVVENEYILRAKDLTSNINCLLHFEDSDALKMLKKNPQPGKVIFKQDMGDTLKIFDKDVSLPPSTTEIFPVIIKPLGKIKTGGVPTELIPTEGFEMRIFY